MSTTMIPVGDEAVSSVFERADGPNGSGALFVCAHGAGGSVTDRGTAATAKTMLAHGVDVLRFNFVYREKGSGRPDPMPKCMQTIEAVVAHARKAHAPSHMIIGGRSMGGRAASMLAAGGFDADGLLLLAYPLHPAGQPEKLRDAHLPAIRMPVICFSGTRDPLCTRELMDRAVATVTAPWTMRWIEGADHSFHVLKSSGRNDADVMREIGAVSREWIDTLKS